MAGGWLVFDNAQVLYQGGGDGDALAGSRRGRGAARSARLNLYQGHLRT